MDKKLLEILACPVSHAGLEYNAQTKELFCRVSKLAYPVREGIPVMLEGEARQLSVEELDGQALNQEMKQETRSSK